MRARSILHAISLTNWYVLCKRVCIAFVNAGRRSAIHLLLHVGLYTAVPICTQLWQRAKSGKAGSEHEDSTTEVVLTSYHNEPGQPPQIYPLTATHTVNFVALECENVFALSPDVAISVHVTFKGFQVFESR